jgi:hypothetical protein
MFLPIEICTYFINKIKHANYSEAFKKEMEDTLYHWPVETNRDDKTVVFIERE